MARTAEDAPLIPVQLPVADGEQRERADAQRNRRKVLSAAERLFACHGVENVSMDAIAALHEHTAALQEQIIRGPAPLGPGAPPKERLKAMARAQLALLEQHGDLMAAGEAGRPGARFNTAPYAFLRIHAGVLIREADPEADWEILADILLAPLGTDAYFYWCTIREHDVGRIAAAFDLLVDRLLP